MALLPFLLLLGWSCFCPSSFVCCCFSSCRLSHKWQKKPHHQKGEGRKAPLPKRRREGSSPTQQGRGGKTEPTKGGEGGTQPHPQGERGTAAPPKSKRGESSAIQRTTRKAAPTNKRGTFFPSLLLLGGCVLLLLMVPPSSASFAWRGRSLLKQ